MLRRLLPALGAIAVLLCVPAKAQERAAVPDGAIRGMAEMFFPSQPLTPEQEARVPAAMALAERIVVPGTYAALMTELSATAYRPMLRLLGLGELDTAFVARQLGLSGEQWEAVPDAGKAELARLLDPAFEQRTPVALAVGMDALREAFTAMEPSVRQAVAEAHARRFTEAQMQDLATFFATPTGAAYASQWLATGADPQIMSVNMEVMPRMFPLMQAAQQRLRAAMDALGERRNYVDLAVGEQERVAALVGMDRAGVERSMAARAARLAAEEQAAAEEHPKP
jgi:hypothetical protein